MVSNEFELLVALVARVLFQSRRQAMRVGDRFLRGQDGFFRSLGAHMRQIDHDADPVHLGHHLVAVAREATISLVAACADQVLRVVAELHHAHPHVVEGLDISQLVFEGVGVLKAQHDAGLAVLLGLLDIRGGARQGQQVAVVADQPLHVGDVGQRSLEVFPHRDGAVGGTDAAFFHVFKNRAVPFGNDEAVDDQCVLVQGAHGRFFQA